MLNFSFQPNVTREFLLSYNNQETYLSYYLGIPVKRGLFRSPLRSDKQPTCSFWKSQNGVIYFKDFATGDNLDFVNVVMNKFGVNYYKALDIIASDFRLINPTQKPKVVQFQQSFKEEKKSDIRVEIKDYTEQELKWWASFGITPKTLNKYKIFSVNTVFLNGEIFAKSQQHCPIYGYYLGKNKDGEQWKCYFPNRKEYRFIGNLSLKVFQGYKQLPKTGKVCVITKSMKDCAALSEFGIPACAPNSETIIPPETVVNDLCSRFKYVFVLWDCDHTGVTFLNKIKRKYPKLKCLIIPRRYKAKDFSDLVKKYGKKKVLVFIKEYIKWLKSS